MSDELRTDCEQKATEASEPQAGQDKLVPVSESIKYRRRAQQAEGAAAKLQQELEDLRGELQQRDEQLAQADAMRDEASGRLQALENERQAERLLLASGATDTETALVLLGRRLDLSGEFEPDELHRAVEQLLVDKPSLCGRAVGALPSATASASAQAGGPAMQLTQAAQRASKTGDRRDVAEYLRLRRRASAST